MRRASSLSAAIAATLFCLSAPAISAQTAAQIQSLAEKTAAAAAKEQPRRMAIGMDASCLQVRESCTRLEESLRADLTKAVPAIQFIPREEILSVLKANGFLAVDAYMEPALLATSAAAGADLLIVAVAKRAHDRFDLSMEIYAPQRAKNKEKPLKTLEEKNFTPGANEIAPSPFYMDPETGIALIIRDEQHYGDVVEPKDAQYSYPGCADCSDQSYYNDPRARGAHGTIELLATISIHGRAEQIVTVMGISPALDARTIASVKHWTFRPATNFFGIAIPARIVLAMQF